jgi:hypothetical protein
MFPEIRPLCVLYSSHAYICSSSLDNVVMLILCLECHNPIHIYSIEQTSSEMSDYLSSILVNLIEIFSTVEKRTLGLQRFQICQEPLRWW